MKILGFFREDIGFLNVHLISESLGIDDTIEFVIDTGANKTVILDKDAVTLGINYKKLKRYERDFVGIGGSIETYVIEDATLLLKAGAEVLEIKTPVFVVKHPIDRISELEKTKILRIPSLLGRDLINRFKLIFDK
ncbi:MAG: hypothetical protein QME59_07915, partial [Candidatus Hydrothermarchaeota archaeon]|nr:hypothetical protein [Candidatus Hydrothermarchaeota archaeon]